MRPVVLPLALALAVGCGGRGDDDARGGRPQGRSLAPGGAAAAAEHGAPDGPLRSTTGAGKPVGDGDLDPLGPGALVSSPLADDASPARRPKSLELLLRSSPGGAVVTIDGEVVGPTPMLWRGPATGEPVEFTFVLPGYAAARYRFVPVQNGVVHGTLERLKTDDHDAGAP